MGLTCTRAHSETLFVSGMVGNLRICHRPVFVGQPFLLIMPYLAQWAVSLPYSTHNELQDLTASPHTLWMVFVLLPHLREH